MKKHLKKLFIILFSLFTGIHAQYLINVQNNFGYTLVDISNAMDIPEYSDITDEGLVEWDKFNYKCLFQIMKKTQHEYFIGAEAGIHRLYYWEKKFYPSSTGSARWNWGTIWTAHAGGLVKRMIADQYYVQTGMSLHIFLNGTGATVGFPLAVGHEIRINDRITLPLEFRVDMIFGNSTPIGLGGGLGLQYKTTF